MIDQKIITQLVEEKLTDDQFIVSIDINTGNRISVLVDSFSGVTIDHCVAISRNIENNLDREVEDFELQVSSAGLGESFKIHQQFVKNTGKEVEVILNDGNKIEGILKSVDDNGFEIESSKREKVEGHKKKQLITRNHRIEFDQAKTVKNIIKF
ncbi:ribosome assembly cofactor RimP [Sunxiuqinia sp. A32]|uniref:ribosome assembly cofactor RimP n=1 Tax=Sunxiuqinia sp. A32 TaxID=3461496 RepID=UPI004045AC80